jgi:hypothetical protein
VNSAIHAIALSRSIQHTETRESAGIVTADRGPLCGLGHRDPDLLELTHLVGRVPLILRPWALGLRW